MAKIREEINYKMFMDSKRKPHAVSIMAEAAYHYVPRSKDKISIDADAGIGPSEPMQNDQTCFFSNIFLKFYNIIKII